MGIETKKDSNGEMYSVWTFDNKCQEVMSEITGHEVHKICSLFGFSAMNHKHVYHILYTIMRTKDEKGNYTFIKLK